MIRVLIDRKVTDGMLEAYHAALREMRLQALQRDGYISGETLRDVTNQRHFIVISTWNTKVDWDRWNASEARHRVMARIAPMLEEPESTLILESA